MAGSDPDRSEGARRGVMIVLSSPSGAGKTTLSRLLQARDAQIVLSISVTTRAPRAGEVDGRDYIFVDRARFDAMVKESALLEWAEVFGHCYGTPRAPVMAALASGRDVLFDIDWQGTQQLRQSARGDLASIFLLPPSLAELEKRLRQRAQDSDAIIQGRMAKAADEMSHWSEYDYVLINHDLDDTFGKIVAILQTERLRTERQNWLTSFVRGLHGAP